MQQVGDRFSSDKKTLTHFDLYEITLSEMLEKIKLLESEKYENYVEHIIAEVEALAALYSKVSGPIETTESAHLNRVISTLHQGRFTGARLVIEEGRSMMPPMPPLIRIMKESGGCGICPKCGSTMHRKNLLPVGKKMCDQPECGYEKH